VVGSSSDATFLFSLYWARFSLLPLLERAFAVCMLLPLCPPFSSLDTLVFFLFSRLFRSSSFCRVLLAEDTDRTQRIVFLTFLRPLSFPRLCSRGGYNSPPPDVVVALDFTLLRCPALFWRSSTRSNHYSSKGFQVSSCAYEVSPYPPPPPYCGFAALFNKGK